MDFFTMNMKTKNTCVAICLLTGVFSSASAQSIKLDGMWKAVLSSGQTAEVTLPGTLDMAGVGIPNALNPAMEKPQLLRLTRKVSYVGECGYSRTIEIPEDMANRPLRLEMERVMWKSSLKIDGKELGQENISLNSPHCFDIPPLSAGKHLFDITIDNSEQRDISFSNLCHSYTNDTQTMWNGVLGNFKLSVAPTVELRSLNVYPDIKKGEIALVLNVDNLSSAKKKRKISITVKENRTGAIVGYLSAKHVASEGRSLMKSVIKLDNPKLWDEFSPSLYTVEAKTEGSSVSCSFGMREVETSGKNLLVNGKKVFLRGTLDCCVFPLTGVPPTDKNGWEKEMQTLKDWGFNHIRFHSWCPPEAAFEVADSLGLYLQTELPVWSLKIGDDSVVTQFLHDEFRHMSESYGNHPSWIMTTCGNELQHDFNVLNNLVKEMKTADGRRLYAAISFTFEKGHGGQAEPFDDFLITQWTNDGWARGQGIFDEQPPSFDKNYSKSMGCVTVPLVSHEIGQYAVYPNMEEIGKYVGTLDPLNFKAVKNDLEAKGLMGKAKDFLDATGRFAHVLYKEEIERAMKTPGFSGVQLLGIQDFPGQGTALVGLIDAFWDAKGMVDAEDFRQFNSPVVPLANFSKAVYSSNEEFHARIDVANYGSDRLENTKILWTLSDEKGKTESGSIVASLIPQGEVAEIGEIDVLLSEFTVPSKLKLILKIENTDYENCWNVWAYPRMDNLVTKRVTVTSDFATAKVALQRGERVLYLPNASKVVGIESKFLPVFWSPVHFPNQAGGMGVLAVADHPSLKGFPNDGHSDWQWWNPVKNASVMLMDSVFDKNTGRNIEPIIGVIDNFYKNRRLGYLFETRCGNGSLIVSSINLKIDSPEIKSLFKGIIDYMESSGFNPANEISLETLEAITNNKNTVHKTNATSIYQ